MSRLGRHRTPRTALVALGPQECPDVMHAAFEQLGCRTTVVQSRRSASELLRLDSFGIVVLGARRGETDGLDIARAARKNPRTRAVPILFVSDGRLDPAIMDASGTGPTDFVFEPLDPVLLLARLRLLMETGELHDRIPQLVSELDARQELFQSAKLASLGGLVASVAHEINNPLAFCIAHLHLAQEEALMIGRRLRTRDATLSHENQRVESRLAETLAGLEEIREIVTRLRTLSRMDDGKKRSACVREGVEMTLAMLRYRLDDRISVQTDFGDPDSVECFPTLLNQAVMNLLTNAIDAIDGKGTIQVSTGSREGRYFIRVADSGRGIAPEHADRVAEPFFTTKPPGEGTGLGLPIVQSIAQAHGGTLELASNGETGTLAVKEAMPKPRLSRGRSAGVC